MCIQIRRQVCVHAYRHTACEKDQSGCVTCGRTTQAALRSNTRGRQRLAADVLAVVVELGVGRLPGGHVARHRRLVLDARAFRDPRRRLRLRRVLHRFLATRGAITGATASGLQTETPRVQRTSLDLERRALLRLAED